VPELPEVESLCRQLREVVAGKQIREARIIDAKLGRLEDVTGCTLLAPFRRGKGLNLPLDDGRVFRLHLRMTGRLLWQPDQPLALPHIRFVMRFEHGRLVLIDPRRFATLELQSGAPPAPQGFDPLEEFPAPLLCESVRRKKMPVKSFLLDQRVIAGIGNIYACEILYRAAINPRRPACDLAVSEWQRLGETAQEVLTRAIACRGTSISDWRDLFGQMGEYQNYLQVYGRAGKPCPRCGNTVERIKLGGRGTFFCPACQP